MNFKISLGGGFTLKKILTLFFIIFLTGCSDSDKVNNSEINEDIAEANTVAESDTTVNLNETKAYSKEILYIIEYLKNKNQNNENEVLYLEYANLDNDSEEEVVIGFGNSNVDYAMDNGINIYSNIYLLEKNGDTFDVITLYAVKNHENSLSEETFIKLEDAVTKIELVKFDGFDVPLLHIEKIELRGAHSFELYRFDNSICELVLSSAVGAGFGIGYNSIIDMDNNGVYDGYIESLYGTGTLFYQINEHYISVDNTFIFNDFLDFEYEPSDTPEDIVLDYYKLTAINDYETPAISSALSEISQVEVEVDMDILKYATVLNTIHLGLDIDPIILFSTETSENTATVLVEIEFEGDKRKFQEFYLEKINDRWIIIGYKSL